MKITKFIKNNILGFIIGAILFGGIGIAVAVQSNIASSDIAYTNSKNANVTSVKQAVDDLYGKVKDVEEISTKLNKYAAYVPTFVKSCDTSNYLTCKVINQYKGNNVSYGVYYHNGTITPAVAGIDASDTTTILDAEDYSFRYAGASSSIGNYVCFGSTATTCPDDNKYRVIGVFTFDGGSTYYTKLIKYTRLSYLTWDNNGNNTWGTSYIRTTLNQTTRGGYLYTIGTNWQNLIYQATWYVGGISESDARAIPKSVYTVEMASTGGSVPPTTGYDEVSGSYIDNTGKIGLIYISDFGYATSPKYWEINLYSGSNEIYSNNWLYAYNQINWSITRRSDISGYVWYYDFNTNSIGRVNYSVTGNFSAGYPYPAFYLNSNVEVSSGTGTSTDPWRIKLS